MFIGGAYHEHRGDNDKQFGEHYFLDVYCELEGWGNEFE
jgi:hypothetical protein